MNLDPTANLQKPPIEFRQLIGRAQPLKRASLQGFRPRYSPPRFDAQALSHLLYL
jgi:hypothetical protein